MRCFECKNIRGHEWQDIGKIFRETLWVESTGTLLCLLSPQLPAQPSPLECLWWQLGQNGVWFGGQDTLEHTKHFASLHSFKDSFRIIFGIVTSFPTILAPPISLSNLSQSQRRGSWSGWPSQMRQPQWRIHFSLVIWTWLRPRIRLGQLGWSYDRIKLRHNPSTWGCSQFSLPFLPAS